MRKSLRLIFASFVIIGGMAVVSFAQEGENDKPKGDKPKGVDAREHNQQKRIIDGVKDGELNKLELSRLEKEQLQIRRQERLFKSDGEFTKVERLKVQRNLNQSSRHIKRAKHN